MRSVASSQRVRKAKKGWGAGGARRGEMRFSRVAWRFFGDGDAVVEEEEDLRAPEGGTVVLDH